MVPRPNQQPEAALMTGSTLLKAFVGLPGGGIAVYTSTGLSYYRHADWLGSSRLTSTQSRTLYSSTAYAPFGERYANSGTADASFTGQNSDTVSSLYDFTFRRQSSSQGRWISPDPAGLAAVDPTNPQTWNRYAYVTNNPLALVDSLGLCDHNELNEDYSYGTVSDDHANSYCDEIDEGVDCNSPLTACVHGNDGNCNSDTFGCYGYFDPAVLPMPPSAPLPPRPINTVQATPPKPDIRMGTIPQYLAFLSCEAGITGHDIGKADPASTVSIVAGGAGVKQMVSSLSGASKGVPVVNAVAGVLDAVMLDLEAIKSNIACTKAIYGR
jgi:RHS repeat-associated protein